MFMKKCNDLLDYLMMCVRVSVGMVNSENPDHTAPSAAGYSGFMLLDELYLEK